MKKLISLIAFAIVAIALPSCTNDKDPEAEGNHRPTTEDNPKIYTYRLSLGGDYIDESEEPLNRSGEAATYVGINVTRKEKGKDNPELEYYASGLFKQKNNITIELVSGYTYDFEVSVLTDKTDTYYTNSDSYGKPFTYNIVDNGFDNAPNYPKEEINKFIYIQDQLEIHTEIENKHLDVLKSGEAKVYIPDHARTPFGVCAYPRTHRYYGTATADPSYIQSGNIEIKLFYKCFGIKIDATNIPVGTTLTVKDVTTGRSDNGSVYEYLQFPKSLIFDPSNDKTIYEEIYSLRDLTGDGNDSFTLEFTWNKGQKKESFEKSFQVRAKYRKTLNVVINGDPNIQSTGNIIINEEGDNLTDDDPIQVSPTESK